MSSGEIESALDSSIANHLMRQILELSPRKLYDLREDFKNKMANLTTPEGIVDRNIMHFVIGRKLSHNG